MSDKTGKFKKGDKVVPIRNTNLGPYLIVVNSDLTISGWKYQCGFPTSKGVLHKTRHHRFILEENLIVYNP
jgi:hypothetical protein